MKTYFKAGVLVAVIFIISISAGCKGRQKMEVFDIKMITSENVHGVIALDDENIWITGNYGTIYHTSDGGENWTKQDSGIKESILCDGVFLDTSTGWVVGINGTILHTTNGGSTWTRQDTGTDRHLFGICFSDENHGWALGEWHTIIHTTDGGKTWKRQGEEKDKILNNIFFVDNKEGWLVGERGIIQHTTDGGANWTAQVPEAFARESFEDFLQEPPPTLFGMCFTDRNNGWACGIDGTIIKTIDGGENWDVLPTVTDDTLYTIFIKYGKGWVVGDKGTYLMSGDGGSTWVLPEEVIKSKKPLRDIYFSSLQKGWAVGAGGTVVRTIDSGETWKFRSGLSYAMKFFQMPKALEFKGMVTE